MLVGSPDSPGFSGEKAAKGSEEEERRRGRAEPLDRFGYDGGEKRDGQKMSHK